MRKRHVQPTLNRNSQQASIVLFTKQGSESKSLGKIYSWWILKQMSWDVFPVSEPPNLVKSFMRKCIRKFKRKKHRSKSEHWKVVSGYSHCAVSFHMLFGNKYFCKSLKILQIPVIFRWNHQFSLQHNITYLSTLVLIPDWLLPWYL